ncbi:hypothetical protein TNCV_3500891 [Trichonephila clavipes]|nr:hypothetical protein TNCV_3500891 [Trichonephila clavipes]
MAPWPHAPVIPQLVDRKTFRDNRWVPSSPRPVELWVFHPRSATLNPHRSSLLETSSISPFALNGVVSCPRVLELVSVHL